MKNLTHRINPIENLDNKIVFDTIDSLKRYFKIPSGSIISRNYDKTDSMSTNEMYFFADCVNNVASVNENWLKNHIKKIESTNPNNSFGSLWEVIFAGILIGSGISVKLQNDSNPGIDVSAEINNTIINFSLKRYDKSIHYKKLELYYKEILKIVKGFRKSNLTVIIILKKYPDEFTIKIICKTIQSYNCKNIFYFENEKYILTIKNNVTLENNLDLNFHSYQLTLISELHKNEKKNLFDKIDDAINNLQRFKKQGLNVIVIHLNQFMPIDSIEKYANEYFKANDQIDINAIIFYQPCITSDEEITQLCHVIKFVLNPQKVKNIFYTDNKNLNWIPPNIVFPVGIISTTSCKNVFKIDNITLNMNEKYWFQRGEIYQKDIKTEKGIQGNIHKISSGILVHSVLQIQDKKIIAKGNFAKHDELEII